MAIPKNNRYYLNFALQFLDTQDIKKVINVTKRLVPRLKGLLGNRLANTKMVEQAKLGMLRFVNANNVRGTPRTNKVYDNFDARKQVNSDGSHFFVFHKFYDKDVEFKYITPVGKKTFLTSGKFILNFLQYGRRGAYRIPKEDPPDGNRVHLSWRYGNGKFIFRNIPPSKRIFVRRKVTWGGGLFDWVNNQIEQYVSDVRDDIAKIIKSEGALPK
jgi:hypothetical protein